MKGLGIRIMAFMRSQHLLQLITGNKITGAQLEGYLTAETKTFSVPNPTTDVFGVFFKPDGLKAYICGTTALAEGRIYQYTLSTAWDISTATDDGVFKSTSTQSIIPNGVTFKSDGLKMFVSYINGLYQYTLSTAWDVSTASYDGYGDINNGGIAAVQSFFKSDGTKVYSATEYAVTQWNLVTPWVVSGITRSGTTKTIYSGSFPENNSKGISFSSDGLEMFITGTDTKKIGKFNLSVAWDVSTASYSGEFYNITEDDSPIGVTLENSVFYLAGNTNDVIIQYPFGVDIENALPQRLNNLTFKGAFSRLIRSGSLKVLQDNSTASAIIAASPTATAMIAAL